jgi:hypothetical protein
MMRDPSPFLRDPANPPFSANVELIKSNRLTVISRKHTLDESHYF